MSKTVEESKINRNDALAFLFRAAAWVIIVSAGVKGIAMLAGLARLTGFVGHHG